MCKPRTRTWGMFMLFSLLLASAICGSWATENINFLGYQGYSGCPGYPLTPAAPSPNTNPVDVSVQLQTAIDDVANNGGGTITIPGDGNCWFLNNPVFLDRDNVTIDGTGAATLASPKDGNYGKLSSTPLLVLGTPRQVSGLEITSSHRTDLYGTLDSSISVNTHFGLKTKGLNQNGTATVYGHGYFDNSLAASGPRIQRGTNPPSQGQLYDPACYTRWLCPLDGSGNPLPGQYQFTFDIAIKQNTAGTLTGTICGAGMANDITQPQTYWMLGTFPNDPDPTNVKFKFKTGNPDAGTYTVQSLVLGAITDTNVHRITVQMDMGGGTCAAWLDGTQTSTLALGSVLNNNGTINLNQQLWRYEQGAFQLGSLHSGALGDVTASGVNSSTQQQVDWTYCGFSLYSSLRYSWAPTLTMAGGGQITDAWRFFSYGQPNFVACLYLADNPQGTTCNSLGTVCNYYEGQFSYYGCGFWLPQRGPVVDGDGNYGIQNLALQYITVNGPVLIGEARALTLASVFVNANDVFDFDDLNSGVINNGALPTITETECGPNANGYSGSYGYSHVYYANKNITSTSLYLTPTLYTQVRLVGCQGLFRGTFACVSGPFEYYFKSFAGPCSGALSVDNPCWDNEGYTSAPAKAIIYHEFSGSPNSVVRETNTLSMLENNPGVINITTPLIQLGNTIPGTLQAERLNWYNPYGFQVQQVIANNNPYAYGYVDSTCPCYIKWQGSNITPYSAGEVLYNSVDGYFYTCAVNHYPGDYYTTNLTSNFADNCPLAGEPWKAYWQRIAVPATWSSGTSYSVNQGVFLYGNYYLCTTSNSASANTEPGVGAQWQSYWQIILANWQYGTAYVAGNDVVCDGAIYQCTANHTSGSYIPYVHEPTRPRPWDLQAANAWQFIQYTAAGTDNLQTFHAEYPLALPPVAGIWGANEPVVYNPNPLAAGTATEYRNPLGGAPGIWRNDDELGEAIQ